MAIVDLKGAIELEKIRKERNKEVQQVVLKDLEELIVYAKKVNMNFIVLQSLVGYKIVQEEYLRGM